MPNRPGSAVILTFTQSIRMVRRRPTGWHGGTREHDYDFVVITDHDLRTPVADGTPDRFLVLPGVEVRI